MCTVPIKMLRVYIDTVFIKLLSTYLSSKLSTFQPLKAHVTQYLNIKIPQQTLCKIDYTVINKGFILRKIGYTIIKMGFILCKIDYTVMKIILYYVKML